MATNVHEKRLKSDIGHTPVYEERYCDMLVEHMGRGLSYETFSAKINTHRQTLYDWEDRYDAWLYAKKRGAEASQLMWESIGVAQAVGDKKRGKGSVPTWIFNMKNRFNWADRNETNISSDGLSIKIDRKDEEL